MSKILIEYNWKGRNPEDKYVLMLMTYTYGCKKSNEKGYNKLSKNIGISKYLLRKSLDRLVEFKALQKSTEKGLGRPTHHFRVDNYFGDITGNDGFAVGVRHKHQIMSILASHVDSKITSGVHQLNCAARLLLISLLANADEGGVVRGLSFAMLERLTGLNSNRVRRLLGVLKESGFISSYWKGFNGSKENIFGKVGSLYFLNLRHPCFKQPSPGLTLLYRATESEGEGEFVTEGKSIAQLVRQETNRQTAQDDVSVMTCMAGQCTKGTGCQADLSSLRDNINRLEPLHCSENDIQFLQLLVEEVASRVLSSHWGQLGGNVPVDIKMTFEKLREDLPKYLASKDYEQERSQINLVMCQLICNAAVALATSLKKAFFNVELPVNCQCTMIPTFNSQYFRKSLTLEVHFLGDADKKGFKVQLFEEQSSALVVKLIDSTPPICADEFTEFGLGMQSD